MPPLFDTPYEAQDPSYNMMQMLAQRCNHDGETMANGGGIGFRREATIKHKAINIILLCENSHRHTTEEV
jgi:hypothetical protein